MHPLKRLPAFVVLVVLSLAGLASPAAADDVTICNTASGEAKILACTSVISAGGQDLSSAYNNRANAYREKGDKDRALADYNEAIRLDPKYALAYFSRGSFYGNILGDKDRALADYNEAIRLDPKYAPAYNNRGNNYSGRGDNGRALADLDEAIRLDPKLALAYFSRGSFYGNVMGDKDRALADYNEAIRLDPKLVLAYNNRGNNFAGRGDKDRALADLNEAIRLDPFFGAAYTNRGLLFERLGKIDKARADFSAALGMSPKYPNGQWARDTAEKRLAALRNEQPTTAPPDQADAARQTRKYRPPLTPQQIAHPSNTYEQFHVALSAYDVDLVRIAMVRFSYDSQRLDWLEKAQQQRDANNINRTKPLIYPTR